jgi:hypothetical protein
VAPPAWWPAYLVKKLRHQAHWKVNDTLLLSHPGCLLSQHRPLPGMLDRIRQAVESQRLTVLVTHWWEYYRDTRPDSAFIATLHGTAEYLAGTPDIQVIAFADLATGRVRLPGIEAAAKPAPRKPYGSGPLPGGRPACLSGIGRSISPAP